MNKKEHIITDVQTLEELEKTKAELDKVNFKIGLTYLAPLASFLSSFAIASVYLSRPEEILAAGTIFGTLAGINVFSIFNPYDRKYYDKTYGPFDPLSDYSPSLNEQKDDLVKKLETLKKEIKGNGKVL